MAGRSLPLAAAMCFAVWASPLNAAPASGPAASLPAGQSKEAVLADFEKGGLNPFENASRLEFVSDHATQGKTAGKIALDAKGFGFGFDLRSGRNLGGTWSQYDRLALDLFVEGGSVKMYCYARDDQSTNYDTRFNIELTLQPGARKIDLPLGSMFRGRTRNPLNVDKIVWISFTFTNIDQAKPATIFLDNTRLVKGTGDFQVKALYTFEGADAGKYVLEDWPPEFKGKSKLEVVAEHATDGKNALKLDSKAPAGNVQFSGFDGDWSRFDTLAMDVFNPSDQPLALFGWVRSGDPAADMSQRHDWQRVVKPGLTTMRFPVGGMTAGRGPKMIDPSKIVAFNLACDNRTVLVDNIRLIKGIEEVPVEGIRKFDFGPATSAVMPGFTAVCKDSAYSKQAGFGWLGGGSTPFHFRVQFRLPGPGEAEPFIEPRGAIALQHA